MPNHDPAEPAAKGTAAEPAAKGTAAQLLVAIASLSSLETDPDPMAELRARRALDAQWDGDLAPLARAVQLRLIGATAGPRDAVDFAIANPDRAVVEELRRLASSLPWAEQGLVAERALLGGLEGFEVDLAAHLRSPVNPERDLTAIVDALAPYLHDGSEGDGSDRPTGPDELALTLLQIAPARSPFSAMSREVILGRAQPDSQSVLRALRDHIAILQLASRGGPAARAAVALGPLQAVAEPMVRAAQERFSPRAWWRLIDQLRGTWFHATAAQASIGDHVPVTQRRRAALHHVRDEALRLAATGLPNLWPTAADACVALAAEAEAAGDEAAADRWLEEACQHDRTATSEGEPMVEQRRIARLMSEAERAEARRSTIGEHAAREPLDRTIGLLLGHARERAIDLQHDDPTAALRFARELMVTWSVPGEQDPHYQRFSQAVRRHLEDVRASALELTTEREATALLGIIDARERWNRVCAESRTWSRTFVAAAVDEADRALEQAPHTSLAIAAHLGDVLERRPERAEQADLRERARRVQAEAARACCQHDLLTEENVKAVVGGLRTSVELQDESSSLDECARALEQLTTASLERKHSAWAVAALDEVRQAAVAAYPATSPALRKFLTTTARLAIRSLPHALNQQHAHAVSSLTPRYSSPYGTAVDPLDVVIDAVVAADASMPDLAASCREALRHDSTASRLPAAARSQLHAVLAAAAWSSGDAPATEAHLRLAMTEVDGADELPTLLRRVQQVAGSQDLSRQARRIDVDPGSGAPSAAPQPGLDKRAPTPRRTGYRPGPSFGSL